MITTYGHTADEDVESFFEAFEKLQRVLDTHWVNCTHTKNENDSVLFQAVEKMFTGTANTDWREIMADPEPKTRSWERFKQKMSRCIATKILPDDAYNLQVTYMQERAKPSSLKVRDWWARIKTINRYLPYFFDSVFSERNTVFYSSFITDYFLL